MTETKTLQILDIYMASFLSLHGIEPSLENNNGRVVFTFQVSDDLYKLMVRFNSNENIPVTSFVTTVKMLRGRMLSMRGHK